jgi:hypothetical protein
MFSNFAFIMKPNRSRSKKPAAITNSRWLAYATAGAASAFTSANSAEATIHYSGRIGEVFDGCHGDFATFRLNARGVFFRLIDDVFICSSPYGGGAYFGMFAPYGASFAGFYNACNGYNALASVSRLRRGDLISNRPFVRAQSGNIALATVSSCGGGYVGQFGGKGTGFIGFKFNNGSGDQYGWARIQMQSGFNFNQIFRLIDYAWGDVGDRITAGQMSSNEMVPEEGFLGALALGAAGLVAWRKRRSRPQSAQS